MDEKEYRDHITSVCLFHKEYLGELHKLECIENNEEHKLWFITRYDRSLVIEQQLFLNLEDAITVFMRLEPLHEEEEEEEEEEENAS